MEPVLDELSTERLEAALRERVVVNPLTYRERPELFLGIPVYLEPLAPQGTVYGDPVLVEEVHRRWQASKGG